MQDHRPLGAAAATATKQLPRPISIPSRMASQSSVLSDSHDGSAGSPHCPQIDYTLAEHGSDVDDDVHEDITVRPSVRRKDRLRQATLQNEPAISSAETPGASEKAAGDSESELAATDVRSDDDDGIHLDDHTDSLDQATSPTDDDDATTSRKASVSLQLFKEAAKAAAATARDMQAVRAEMKSRSGSGTGASSAAGSLVTTPAFGPPSGTMFPTLPSTSDKDAYTQRPYPRPHQPSFSAKSDVSIRTGRSASASTTPSTIRIPSTATVHLEYHQSPSSTEVPTQMSLGSTSSVPLGAKSPATADLPVAKSKSRSSTLAGVSVQFPSSAAKAGYSIEATISEKAGAKASSAQPSPSEYNLPVQVSYSSQVTPSSSYSGEHSFGQGGHGSFVTGQAPSTSHGDVKRDLKRMPSRTVSNASSAMSSPRISRHNTQYNHAADVDIIKAELHFPDTPMRQTASGYRQRPGPQTLDSMRGGSVSTHTDGQRTSSSKPSSPLLPPHSPLQSNNSGFFSHMSQARPPSPKALPSHGSAAVSLPSTQMMASGTRDANTEVASTSTVVANPMPIPSLAHVISATHSVIPPGSTSQTSQSHSVTEVATSPLVAAGISTLPQISATVSPSMPLRRKSFKIISSAATQSYSLHQALAQASVQPEPANAVPVPRPLDTDHLEKRLEKLVLQEGSRVTSSQLDKVGQVHAGGHPVLERDGSSEDSAAEKARYVPLSDDHEKDYDYELDVGNHAHEGQLQGILSPHQDRNTKRSNIVATERLSPAAKQISLPGSDSSNNVIDTALNHQQQSSEFDAGEAAFADDEEQDDVPA